MPRHSNSPLRRMTQSVRLKRVCSLHSEPMKWWSQKQNSYHPRRTSSTRIHLPWKQVTLTRHGKLKYGIRMFNHAARQWSAKDALINRSMLLKKSHVFFILIRRPFLKLPWNRHIHAHKKKRKREKRTRKRSFIGYFCHLIERDWTRSMQ